MPCFLSCFFPWRNLCRWFYRKGRTVFSNSSSPRSVCHTSIRHLLVILFRKTVCSVLQLFLIALDPYRPIHDYDYPHVLPVASDDDGDAVIVYTSLTSRPFDRLLTGGGFPHPGYYGLGIVTRGFPPTFTSKEPIGIQGQNTLTILLINSKLIFPDLSRIAVYRSFPVLQALTSHCSLYPLQMPDIQPNTTFSLHTRHLSLYYR